MEEYKILADLIFPDIKLTIDDYEKMYHSRDLDDMAIVSRYAPSPTGFIHIGALLATFTESTFARQTNGKLSEHNDSRIFLQYHKGQRRLCKKFRLKATTKTH